MQDAHIYVYLQELHRAVVDIVVVMNEPQRDLALMREAGVEIDRALFPLLVGIERFGPIGIVELAGRAGRDYTTVSRQVGKLEGLGLVSRLSGTSDRRVSETTVTPRGAEIVARIDEARDRIGRAIFQSWSDKDLADLSRLMTRFAAALKGGPTAPAPE